MIGGQGFESVHQNFNMGHNMIMPGMNDAPLEFNMNKNIPTVASDGNGSNDESQQRRSSDGFDQSGDGGPQNDNRGNNKKRLHDRDNRRRDRKDHEDKERRERHERNRIIYKGNRIQDNQERNNLGMKLNDNRLPEDIISDNNLQPNGMGPQPGKYPHSVHVY